MLDLTDPYAGIGTDRSPSGPFPGWPPWAPEVPQPVSSPVKRSGPSYHLGCGVRSAEAAFTTQGRGQEGQGEQTGERHRPQRWDPASKLRKGSQDCRATEVEWAARRAGLTSMATRPCLPHVAPQPVAQRWPHQPAQPTDVHAASVRTTHMRATLCSTQGGVLPRAGPPPLPATAYTTPTSVPTGHWFVPMLTPRTQGQEPVASRMVPWQVIASQPCDHLGSFPSWDTTCDVCWECENEAKPCNFCLPHIHLCQKTRWILSG